MPRARSARSGGPETRRGGSNTCCTSSWPSPLDLRIRAAVALVLVFGLGGCTTVEVHGADVQRWQVPGLSVLQVRPAAGEAAIVRTRALGLWLGGHAATLGWVAEDTLIAPDTGACRVVVWVRSEAEVAALRDRLKSGRLDGSLCVITPAGIHSKEVEP